MESKVKIGKYKHFKGGVYTVICTAFNSEDREKEFVIYKSEITGKTWARPIDMFLEEVDKNGYKGPRFTYIGE